MDRDNHQVRADAGRELDAWLRTEAAKYGMVEEVSWDHPDMFIAHVRLSPRLMLIVWMNAEPTDEGCRLEGAGVISDSDSTSENFSAEHRIAPHAIAGDYRALTSAMKTGFERLFAELAASR